jgi:hypothetical protein
MVVELIQLVLFFGVLIGMLIGIYEGLVRFAWFMLCKAIEVGEVKGDIFGDLARVMERAPSIFS